MRCGQVGGSPRPHLLPPCPTRLPGCRPCQGPGCPPAASARSERRQRAPAKDKDTRCAHLDLALSQLERHAVQVVPHQPQLAAQRVPGRGRAPRRGGRWGRIVGAAQCGAGAGGWGVRHGVVQLGRHGRPPAPRRAMQTHIHLCSSTSVRRSSSPSRSAALRASSVVTASADSASTPRRRFTCARARGGGRAPAEQPLERGGLTAGGATGQAEGVVKRRARAAGRTSWRGKGLSRRERAAGGQGARRAAARARRSPAA